MVESVSWKWRCGYRGHVVPIQTSAPAADKPHGGLRRQWVHGIGRRREATAAVKDSRKDRRGLQAPNNRPEQSAPEVNRARVSEQNLKQPIYQQYLLFVQVHLFPEKPPTTGDVPV